MKKKKRLKLPIYKIITMCNHQYDLKWNSKAKIHSCSNCDEEFIVTPDLPTV